MRQVAFGYEIVTIIDFRTRRWMGGRDKPDHDTVGMLCACRNTRPPDKGSPMHSFDGHNDVLLRLWKQGGDGVAAFLGGEAKGADEIAGDASDRGIVINHEHPAGAAPRRGSGGCGRGGGFLAGR